MLGTDHSVPLLPFCRTEPTRMLVAPFSNRFRKVSTRPHQVATVASCGPASDRPMLYQGDDRIGPRPCPRRAHEPEGRQNRPMSAAGWSTCSSRRSPRTRALSSTKDIDRVSTDKRIAGKSTRRSRCRRPRGRQPARCGLSPRTSGAARLILLITAADKESRPWLKVAGRSSL